jgi:hypothetical protein
MKLMIYYERMYVHMYVQEYKSTRLCSSCHVFRLCIIPVVCVCVYSFYESGHGTIRISVDDDGLSPSSSNGTTISG